MIVWMAYEIVTSWTESTPRRWRQSYEGRQPQCASFRAKDDIRVVRRHSLTLKITGDTDCYYCCCCCYDPPKQWTFASFPSSSISISIIINIIACGCCATAAQKNCSLPVVTHPHSQFCGVSIITVFLCCQTLAALPRPQIPRLCLSFSSSLLSSCQGLFCSVHFLPVRLGRCFGHRHWHCHSLLLRWNNIFVFLIPP